MRALIAVWYELYGVAIARPTHDMLLAPSHDIFYCLYDTPRSAAVSSRRYRRYLRLVSTKSIVVSWVSHSTSC